MTRDEMIAYIKANPYHRISHTYFLYEEYLYSGDDGNVYDEHGNLFEDWVSCERWNGIRIRNEDYWSSGWYVKDSETCQYKFTIPRFGICCRAYSKSNPTKENPYHHWAHYPECCKKNCPLKHPELLKGRTL